MCKCAWLQDILTRGSRKRTFWADEQLSGPPRYFPVMKLICTPSTLRGSVEIPGSKSHTIRAVAIASLAHGESRIRGPLESDDTEAAVRAYSALGADIRVEPGEWRIKGTGGALRAPTGPIDVGNSGTTLRIAMGSSALVAEGITVLTGDDQIRRRPAGPLVGALNDLGAQARFLKDNGCPPVEIRGPIQGGTTSIKCETSQYLSSLLMCAPLAERDTVITVPLLNEAPYVGITIDWLTRHGIKLEYAGDYSEFAVPGGQRYQPVNRRIPADFSSGTFFLAAGALGENDIESLGLDMNDTQGDKAVVDYLRAFGARVDVSPEGVRVSAKNLKGCELDLNATPDALPMMAVLGCFASGETRLVNVPQARIKETDRIAVMKEELETMGADIEELPDGLVVRESRLKGAVVNGHADHRVVMSLAIAAMAATGETIIEGAEAADVTYPGFRTALASLNAELSTSTT